MDGRVDSTVRVVGIASVAATAVVGPKSKLSSNAVSNEKPDEGCEGPVVGGLPNASSKLVRGL